VSRAAMLALALAVGCSKQAPAPAGEPPPPPLPTEVDAGSPAAESAPGGPEMATMGLLDPGRAPRRKLRYVWRADRKEVLDVDLRTATSTEIAGEKPAEIPLPPVHFVIALEPQRVTDEGTLLYAWHVSSATVGESPESPSQVADGMRAEVAAIARLSGTAQVTSRGLAKDIAIDAASVTDAGATGQMIEQVRQTLRDLAAPFPDEDVGPGARWEKVSQLASKDARITQTDTFSLLEVAGDKGRLDDVLAQAAPPQSLAGTGGAAGERARLESMLASGDAKTRFDLSRLAPQTTFDGTTTMVVSGPPGDHARRLTMIMRIKIALSGSVR